MALFMDVHRKVTGLTPGELEEIARSGLETARAKGVEVRNFWYNAKEGCIFCLCEASSKEAAIEAHRASGEPIPDEIFEVKEGSLH
ncbi:guanylate cyclase [Desulfuromonas versatilis]|uniref:Guanylate cyclase n=1 Tax=Desulfuromonas versatilis TaxID=2802975 RepID=A0ABM8HUU1_9BACT|nr:nickel-binding protein [Desulfuromonas versatilis]BCR04273.1 guanylate cyclase [Desulfuromonas versatilis]